MVNIESRQGDGGVCQMLKMKIRIKYFQRSKNIPRAYGTFVDFFIFFSCDIAWFGYVVFRRQVKQVAYYNREVFDIPLGKWPRGKIAWRTIKINAVTLKMQFQTHEREQFNSYVLSIFYEPYWYPRVNMIRIEPPRPCE